ncbi:MAG: FKBP-type peptidyl-prolyl cis-trans isomerase [Candidatus Sericytochromatia bacterium]|nr:FKBP-type peptidyl-prolyl cis-trans isomerase [Candidatus Sericytochromatia bacterium]
MKNIFRIVLSAGIIISSSSCAWIMKDSKKNDSISIKSTDPNIIFLEQNKQNKDVITTNSGLQYKIITKGTGKKPRETDTVKVNYRGTLINGKEFDSSYGRGAAVFPLNRVISGWTEGLQLMPVGSKYIFYIPSGLGYGSREVGSDIPANSALIFEVDLLDIEK